ncbi:MAG: sn-glycerol-3-phosphate ABC transporter ATP-binding protein UgpC [Deltaproteobacteria bacterium]|nr:sn-glycerol-3-phosphate ABC transporter ATP-binding protein UgpC [Deltaproteobacteria bacterium]
MADLKLINIFKSFGDLEVLHNINMEAKEGEFVVLVGPSGCGKTTILRLIAGLEEVTAGEVIINNRVVNTVEPHHRNIAMVFQNYALYPHKNVKENIIFSLKRAGSPKELIYNRLEKASRLLELQDLLDRKPAQLSGGQKQRVAMGRAIVRDADLFLFDEPLSNLDAKLRYQMRSEIRRIHREYGTTSVYVTHDQLEAMTLGDRVVVMRDGRIEQQGSPMDIYMKPVNIFVATFIGAPSMNMLDARLFRDFVELEGRKIPLGKRIGDDLVHMPDEGKEIKLGIRPDFFQDEHYTDARSALSRIEDVKIDLVEPLGFDIEIDAKLGAQPLKARLDIRSSVRDGDSINLCFDMDRAHFFDIKTGENLSLDGRIRISD